jgi:hypothetical protein
MNFKKFVIKYILVITLKYSVLCTLLKECVLQNVSVLNL